MLDRAAELVGTYRPHPNGAGNANAERAETEKAQRIASILNDSVPAAGTYVETYFNTRGVDLPPCDDVRFHPSLKDDETTSLRPGMVAIARYSSTGEPTGGIHRTFLSDDGTAKASIGRPKKMLGSSSGGFIRLTPMGDDGCLGIAEGIEKSLAATKIFGIPVWSAMSAGNIPKFEPPPGLKTLVIFADRGDAGESNAWRLPSLSILQALELSITVAPYFTKIGQF